MKKKLVNLLLMVIFIIVYIAIGTNSGKNDLLWVIVMAVSALSISIIDFILFFNKNIKYRFWLLAISLVGLATSIYIFYVMAVMIAFRHPAI